MRKDDALDKLRDLIGTISRVHESITEKWMIYANTNQIPIFNQKSNKVSDIGEKRLMPIIKEYVSFLNGCEEVTDFDDTDKEFTINSRIKNVNSIEEKYSDYINCRKEHGKVSINKCYNDLFGIRVIIDCKELTHDDIVSAISGNGIQLEEKNEKHNKLLIKYKATHIYFKKNNESFRWELQVWKLQDEKDNQESHKNHRFRYKEWEKQSKKSIDDRQGDADD